MAIGVSGGGAADTGCEEQPAIEPREFEILYDFNMPVMGRHGVVLSQIVRFADDIGARRVVITATRGSTLLSDGQVMTENLGIAEARAKELRELLKGGGLRAVIDVAPPSQADRADGIDDWRSRQATVRVEP